MKNGVFYGKGIQDLKDTEPELYSLAEQISNVCYSGTALDYKTQKLIAIAIEASKSDDKAIRKQMTSGIEELGITPEEIMDALKIVLLTSGMPAFSKAVKILNTI